MKALILSLLAFSANTAWGQTLDQPKSISETVAYYGASHVGTEAILKFNKVLTGEWEISAYNRVLASLIVASIAWNHAQSSEDPTLNMMSSGLGIISGNIMQIEW